jgi:hypothetical protein
VAAGGGSVCATGGGAGGLGAGTGAGAGALPELALQCSQFVIAYFEQAARFVQLALQVIDPSLQSLILGIRLFGIRRFAAGAGRSAGTRARTRGDEAQVAAAGCTCSALPGIHLAVHFVHRFALIQGRDFVRAGQAQHGAAFQNIDVAAERARVGAVHGDHGLIEIRSVAGARVQAAHDLGERVAFRHRIGAPSGEACAAGVAPRRTHRCARG